MIDRVFWNWALLSVTGCVLASGDFTRAEEPQLPVLPSLPAPATFNTAITDPPLVTQEQTGRSVSGTNSARIDLQRRRLSEIAKASGQFVELPLDGSLSGWNALEGKKESWSVDGTVLSCLRAGGGWLCTKELYSDFVLRFEYRLTAGANTGVAFHCEQSGNPTLTGFEVQLLDDSAEKYVSLRPEQYTGSLYYRRAPQQRAPVRPLGAWNTAEIVCFGDLLRVTINDVLVNEVTLSDMPTTPPPIERVGATESAVRKVRPTLGPIGLQSHSTRVDFRNLRIRDLSVQTPSGLRIVDVTTGTGGLVAAASVVQVQFTGQLVDGLQFADSRMSSEPVTVALEDVIPGWQEGIAGMRVGGRRRIIVPPDSAYGEEGVEGLIPPHATLVFDVEVVGIIE